MRVCVCVFNSRQFDMLDTTGDGRLNRDDLRRMVEERKRKREASLSKKREVDAQRRCCSFAVASL